MGGHRRTQSRERRSVGSVPSHRLGGARPQAPAGHRPTTSYLWRLGKTTLDLPISTIGQPPRRHRPDITASTFQRVGEEGAGGSGGVPCRASLAGSGGSTKHIPYLGGAVEIGSQRSQHLQHVAVIVALDGCIEENSTKREKENPPKTTLGNALETKRTSGLECLQDSGHTRTRNDLGLDSLP